MLVCLARLVPGKADQRAFVLEHHSEAPSMDHLIDSRLVAGPSLVTSALNADVVRCRLRRCGLTGPNQSLPVVTRPGLSSLQRITRALTEPPPLRAISAFLGSRVFTRISSSVTVVSPSVLVVILTTSKDAIPAAISGGKSLKGRRRPARSRLMLRVHRSLVPAGCAGIAERCRALPHSAHPDLKNPQ